MDSVPSTILFTDIVGSSKLYSKHGNAKAKALIDSAIDKIKSLVNQHAGETVKTIGDEVMAQFSAVDQAFACAKQCHINLLTLQLELRTGLCFGETILDQQDVFGDTVNNAAFYTKHANAGQILTDQYTLQQASTLVQSSSDLFDSLPIKGRQDNSKIFRFNWEDQTHIFSTTQLIPAEPVKGGNEESKLRLDYKEFSVIVSPSSPRYSIGRDFESVDLHVPNRNASRNHCSIFFRRGKFVLKDHSTNGTYLSIYGRDPIFLRNETAPLTDSGKFSLGNSNEASEHQIYYKLN